MLGKNWQSGSLIGIPLRGKKTCYMFWTPFQEIFPMRIRGGGDFISPPPVNIWIFVILSILVKELGDPERCHNLLD